MKLLLIDTCGAEGSVALAEGSQVLAAEVLPGRSASERLVPVIRLALEGQGLRLGELAAIVVVHGPGSFTGVRVGLSAAKGLSEAAGVPLVAVSRLAVLARGAGRVLAVLDAGRGEFYFGEYVDGRCVGESLVTQAELVEAVGGAEVVVCEARVVAALEGVVRVRVVAEPVAGDVVGIGMERVEAGSFDDAAVVDANYLRRTDEQLFARPKVAV
ncbi:tRNA (adenosine(37)-N6)-threonylcarbamoyltransferase complex dimerization subunit type 1 TsaB [Granulicella arctica]|uniref:tRNA (adenosine(37)-N6)-threonylcarbamoyltransferase complex dimerization subunit type 1 TsaB n=1 Tax=Granulicella arctica TaxID=940613 RepID=UPI0021E08F59|nr:tRNA (adenosine(37)-N6)-threonylcarbamoyltransferase complex dimerization subunit type 1 TsaB [Granulicella arctica]